MKDSPYQQQSHQTRMLTFAGDLPNICSLAGLLCALLGSPYKTVQVNNFKQLALSCCE